MKDKQTIGNEPINMELGKDLRGLTKREYMAIQILNGLISCPTFDWKQYSNHAVAGHINAAIIYTDALINKLNKPIV